MENASKALLITAGVILGVMLLSVMIYLFRQGARVNQTYDQKQISLQLELYNSKFEAFDRDNNNIMDVISLCNLAFDVNKEVEFDKASSVQVEVIVGSKKYILPNTNDIDERNLILDGSKPMSIYNLVEYPLGDGNGTLKLSTIPAGGNKSDKLSDTKLENGKTKYKYQFRVEEFDYNPNNKKVSNIKLVAYYNW